MASYNGKLLWVNHDADNLRPKVNRYTVFSHVQNEYHRWRRQDAIERLKASSRIPRTPQNKSIRRRKAPLIKGEDSTEKTDLLSEAPPVLVASEDDNEHRLQLAKWHGNSDPFSAFSVPITARVNQLMSFERDVLHPAVHGRWALRATEWDYCSACWSWILPHLDTSVGGCYGFLATAATILAKSVQEHSVYLRLSLVYRHQAVKTLQSQVAQSTRGNLLWHTPAATPDRWYQQANEPDLIAVFTLLLCEMFNENFDAAATHLHMLKSIMGSTFSSVSPSGLPPPSLSSTTHNTTTSNPTSMRSNLFSRVLFQDIERSASTLTPTVLPMSTTWWSSIGMSSAVHPTTIPSQPHPPDANNIPPSTPLHPLFSSIRELSLQLVFGLPTASNTKTKPDLTPSDFFYIWNYGQILMGRCLNHALACKPLHLHRDVYASLAMVVFIRHMSSREGIAIIPNSGVKFYNANRRLLSEMKGALLCEAEAEAEAEKDVEPARKVEVKPRELRLWAFYVGMLCGGDQWFEVQLRELAMEMGVERWSDAEAIFKGFSVHGHSEEVWWRGVRGGK